CVVAMNLRKRKLESMGRAARDMIGRTPGYITAVRPLREGVIADYTVTYNMLGEIRREAVGRLQSWVKPNALIAVPCNITNVEKRAVEKAALSAGFGRVKTIEAPMAAAIGAGLPISTPTGNMVVDLGGGTTDIAVISLGGLVHQDGLRIGGDKMDEAIARAIRSRYDLLIGDQMAEEIKISIGSAYPLDSEVRMTVRGRDLEGGLPRSVEVSSQEIRDALEEPIRQITDRICDVLEQTPPELSADIIERGIHLTGGGARLRGLDRLIQTLTGIHVIVAEPGDHCVILGIGESLEEFDLLTSSGR
ncbi:MAG: rod shape-determining protein, partial [Fimbriimonadaceae bacterium]|nr:rod shape-determining protein [Fimbriimonadaceae bacterium]